MTTEFHPGDGVLFMKVGVHAQESLESIIERKQQEISDAGYAMWGYGGSTCHPLTMVRPFAEAHALSHQPILLCMEKVNSHHYAQPIRAEQCFPSPEGYDWADIPEAINVWGSRYALFIDNLRLDETTLHLGDTAVAVGRSVGRSGEAYIKGRVDKACLDILPTESHGAPKTISLVANVIAPFAALLRNRP